MVANVQTHIRLKTVSLHLSDVHTEITIDWITPNIIIPNNQIPNYSRKDYASGSGLINTLIGSWLAIRLLRTNIVTARTLQIIEVTTRPRAHNFSRFFRSMNDPLIEFIDRYIIKF